MKYVSLMQADENTLMQAIDGTVRIIEPGGWEHELKLTLREREVFEQAKQNHFVVRKGRWKAQTAYRLWCWINEEIYTCIVPQKRGKSADIVLDLAYGSLLINDDVDMPAKQLLDPHGTKGTLYDISLSKEILSAFDAPSEAAEELARKLIDFAKDNSHRNSNYW